MEDLFNSIYYYTNGFYSVELDSYLYETIPGYRVVETKEVLLETDNQFQI